MYVRRAVSSHVDTYFTQADIKTGCEQPSELRFTKMLAYFSNERYSILESCVRIKTYQQFLYSI